jgi:hypothetical protein
MKEDPRCSFCGRDDEHVRFLAKGVSGGLICDVCCLKAFLIFLKAHLQAVVKPSWRRRRPTAS